MNLWLKADDEFEVEGKEFMFGWLVFLFYLSRFLLFSALARLLLSKPFCPIDFPSVHVASWKDL